MHILGILRYYPSHTMELVLDHICVCMYVIINDIIVLNAVDAVCVCMCVYVYARDYPQI